MLQWLDRLEDIQLKHDLNPLCEVILIEKGKVFKDAPLLFDAWLERYIQVLVYDRVLQNKEVEEAEKEHFIVVACRPLLTRKNWLLP